MTDVRIFSDIGLALFQKDLSEVRENGGDIKLCNVRDELLSIIKLLKLDVTISICNSVDDALAAFGKGA
jgi:anti-anti-sigma regulatory factor